MEETVSVQIQVSAKEVPETFALYSVNTQTQINGPGKAVITYQIDLGELVDNTNAITRFFKSGLPVTISMGYGSQTSPVFSGIITQQYISVSLENHTIEIICEEYSCILESIPVPANINNQSFVSSISPLLRKNGFKLNIISRIKSVVAHPESSGNLFDLILSTAKLNGLNVLVKDKLLTLAPADYTQKPVASLTMGVNIITLQAEGLIHLAANQRAADKAQESGILTCRAILHIQGSSLAIPGKLAEINETGEAFSGKAYIIRTNQTLQNGNWLTVVTTGLGY